MTPRPPSASPRPSFASRVLRTLRRLWLDTLPVAGWVSAWREDRRRKQAAARRPQLPRLLPAFDPFEDRSFLGLDFTGALQVALVGTGAALFGEFLHQAFTHVDPLPAPVPPGTAPQAAALGGDPAGMPIPSLGLGGGGGDEGGGRGWVTQFATAADVPEEIGTRLTSPDLSGSVPDLGGLDQDGLNLGSDAPQGTHGGGGGAPPSAEANPSAGGSASGPSASATPSGGSFTPTLSPAGTAAGDAASFAPGNSKVSGTAAAGTPLMPPVTTAGHGVAPAAGASLADTVGPTNSHTPDASNVSKTYGQLPLPFEPNLGQTDPGVQFLSHGPGFGFFLTADGAATFSLARAGQGATPGASVTRDVLRLSLDGAAAAPRIVAQDQQAGYSNYFASGASPLSVTNVPQYGAVVEKSVYPGIDLVWHSTANRQLEYDFVVAPGADPSAIRLHIDGATGLSNDAQGNLLIQTGGGTLVQSAPVITQAAVTTGAAPQAVGGSAVLLPGGDLGFRPGAYDTRKPLTIDPVIQYSSYLGGSGDDQAFAVAADGSGDSYVTGSTTSTNFPTTTGAYQTSFPNTGSLFITKLNAQGTAYVYSTYLAGASILSPQLFGVAVDLAGDAYVTGTAFDSFPTTTGAYQTAYNSAGSFVTKLSATGDALLYSTYFGISTTAATAIALDGAGDAYITGYTGASSGGTSFPTTAR